MKMYRFRIKFSVTSKDLNDKKINIAKKIEDSFKNYKILTYFELVVNYLPKQYKRYTESILLTDNNKLWDFVLRDEANIVMYDFVDELLTEGPFADDDKINFTVECKFDIEKFVKYIERSC